MNMMLKESFVIKKNFKILSIDHVAVATENSDVLQLLLSDVLGLHSDKKEYVKSEKINVVKVYADDKKTAIELLEPTNDASPIKKFLSNKGNGIHHISLMVDNINNAINYLLYNNISLVYEKPHPGSDNTLITFIHPKSSPGMLIELCEKS